jgi:hypothetical protein
MEVHSCVNGLDRLLTSARGRPSVAVHAAEYRHGRCARNAERKTIRDADTIPRSRAHNQVIQSLEADGTLVSQDVKETHKLAVQVARCQHDQRQESLVVVM